MSKIWGKIATQLQRSPSDISQRCAACNCDMVRKMVNSHHAEDGKSYSQLAQKFNPRFVNLPQLWESAAAGCHGCRVLADTIVSLNSGGTARMEDLSSYRLPPEKYATCLVRYEPTGPGKHLRLEVKSSNSTANESYVAEIYHEEGRNPSALGKLLLTISHQVQRQGGLSVQFFHHANRFQNHAAQNNVSRQFEAG